MANINSDLQTLALQGDRDAMYELASRCPDNEEASKIAWATYWFEKAANTGHVLAKKRYAEMLMKIRSEKYSENRQKAMNLFDSLAKDFNDGKFFGDDRKVGMEAKIELGIMLCEGIGTPRNHVRGIRLIKEGEENMDETGGMSFAYFVRIGELYAMGYAQEDEEPARVDLVRAIEYLGGAIRKFNSDSDDSTMFYRAQQLLDIQEKQLPNKRALEEKRAGLTNLPGFPEDMKLEIEKEQREYNQKEAKKRRFKLEYPTITGQQAEDVLLTLRERFAKEEKEVKYASDNSKDDISPNDSRSDTSVDDNTASPLLDMLAENIEKFKSIAEKINQKYIHLIPAEKESFPALRFFWQQNDFDPEACEALLKNLATGKNKHPTDRELLEALQDFRRLCRDYYTKDSIVFEAFQKAMGGKKNKKNPQYAPIPNPEQQKKIEEEKRIEEEREQREQQERKRIADLKAAYHNAIVELKNLSTRYCSTPNDYIKIADDYNTLAIVFRNNFKEIPEHSDAINFSRQCDKRCAEYMQRYEAEILKAKTREYNRKLKRVFWTVLGVVIGLLVGGICVISSF